MIKLDNIVATYTTTRGQVNAVDGVNLAIPSGEIVGIAGESGCGKSTLLKVIYGDLTYPLSLKTGSVHYGFDPLRQCGRRRRKRSPPATSRSTGSSAFPISRKAQ